MEGRKENKISTEESDVLPIFMLYSTMLWTETEHEGLPYSAPRHRPSSPGRKHRFEHVSRSPNLEFSVHLGPTKRLIESWRWVVPPPATLPPGRALIVLQGRPARAP